MFKMYIYIVSFANLLLLTWLGDANAIAASVQCLGRFDATHKHIGPPGVQTVEA